MTPLQPSPDKLKSKIFLKFESDLEIVLIELLSETILPMELSDK